MGIFTGLKLLALLRRLAIATERLADIEAERLEHERKQWRLDAARALKKPRATEFGAFDVDAANELYRREQEAAAVGATLEDRTTR